MGLTRLSTLTISRWPSEGFRGQQISWLKTSGHVGLDCSNCLKLCYVPCHERHHANRFPSYCERRALSDSRFSAAIISGTHHQAAVCVSMNRSIFFPNPSTKPTFGTHWSFSSAKEISDWHDRIVLTCWRAIGSHKWTSRLLRNDFSDQASRISDFRLLTSKSHRHSAIILLELAFTNYAVTHKSETSACLAVTYGDYVFRKDSSINKICKNATIISTHNGHLCVNIWQKQTSTLCWRR